MNTVAPIRGGALETYAQLKLELGDLVRALLQLADKGHNFPVVHASRQLLAQLAEDRFNLALVGQFSRGKSSLMNALLGSEKLPTGALPLTSVATTVGYGERERVLIERQGWNAPQEVRLEQLAEYVTQTGNPGNEKRVTRAEVQLPNELLRLGVHFIDTPGVASMVTANTRAARRVLPQADAAILVTSFESPLTEAEMSFAGEVAEHARTMFVVVNKQDLVAPSERETVRAAVAAALRGMLPQIPIEVFALSAREALQARLAGDAAGLEASGLPPLQASLARYLRQCKARDLLLRAADRAAAIARRHRLTLLLGAGPSAAAPRVPLVLAHRGDEAEPLRARLEQQLERLEHEREALIRRLGLRLRNEWVTAVESRLGFGEAGLAELLAAAVQSPSQVEERPLQRVFSQTWAAWLQPRREALEDIFRQAIGPEAEALDQLLEQIAAVPGAVLGAGSEPEPSPAPLPPLYLPEIRLSPEKDRPPWWYASLPAGRWRAFLVRRWMQRLPRWSEMYGHAVRDLLGHAATLWSGNLDRDLAERIADAGAQMREWLDRPPDPGDQAVLDRILDQLREFSVSADVDGDTTLASVSTGAAAQPAPDCPICLRVEKAVMDGLSRLQYDLNLDEAERRRHAVHAGFCPLHTWQYEAIASPQGVCAAYPTVLLTLAEELQRLAARRETAAELAAGVRDLLPHAQTCPVCKWVEAEAGLSARDLVRAAASQPMRAAASLCLPHLITVLEAAPPRPAAWVEGAVSGLQRAAEDMRNYALKHAAIRRELATGAERRAAIGALARVVGRRAVVAPWRIE